MNILHLLHIDRESKACKLILTILAAMAGGLLFIAAHIPLPWLLGPMVVLLIASKIFKNRFYWHVRYRNWGLIIIGYTSGSAINRHTIVQIARQLPCMLAMTVGLIAFCALSAYLVSRLTAIDYPSVLAGSIPGGLTQMIAMGEELEGLDMTIIATFQIIRMIMILSCVPLIIYSPLYVVEKNTAAVQTAAAVLSEPLMTLIPRMLFYAAVSALFAMLAKKIRLPIPYYLGPIIGIALLSLLGFHGPDIPRFMAVYAQFALGCYLGLLLKPENIPNKFRTFSISIIHCVAVIVFTLGLSYILMKTQNISATTSFLSLAPGGSDQMGLIAKVISADVSMVAGYQIFRILFINFFVPPSLRMFYRRYTKTKKSLPASEAECITQEEKNYIQ